MAKALRQCSHAVMRIAPLCPPAIGLILGIAFDRYVQSSMWLYIAGAIVGGAVSLIPSVRALLGPLLLLVASGCVGGMLHLSTARTTPGSSVERYVGDCDGIARIRGTVASTPRILTSDSNPFARWTYGSDRTLFLLDAESIEGVRDDIPVSGRIRVTIGEVVLDIRENERVEVFGKLYPLRPPRNPGGFDWASYYRRQGIVAGFSCALYENVRRLDAVPPSQNGDPLTRVRTTVRGLLTDDLASGADEEASLLEAMILGHRSGLDRRLNDAFVRAGCIHFLAVSGVHVVIVMFLARLACRVCVTSPRTRIWAMLLAVIAYVIIAEPRPPILRAGVISSLYCIACLMGRQRTCLNWISASAIILLVVEPTMIFDIGFQLSFAAVIGVSYVTPAVSAVAGSAKQWCLRRIRGGESPIDSIKLRDQADLGGSALRDFVRSLVQMTACYIPTALAVAAGAWLVALPIIAVHFQRVQPWAALNSALVFPLVGLVMAIGFAKLFIGVLFPTVGLALGVVLTATDSLLIRVVDLLAALPGVSVAVEPPPWWLICSFYTFLLSLAARYSNRQHHDHPTAESGEQPERKHPQWSGSACALALALLLVTCIEWFRPRAPQEQLVFTTLAVGAGMATVLELPDGQTILYDAGTSSPYDVGRHVVVPFLRDRGIERIDLIYISHPNLDHLSGVPTIIDEIKAGAMVVNHHFEPLSAPASPARHLLNVLAERGTEVRTLVLLDRVWDYGGVRFELLAPLGNTNEPLSANGSSTVLRISYAGYSILLTGDIEDRTQRALLLAYNNLHADVLILPHHGSVRPTSAEFIAAVAPRIAVRSSNKRMDETFTGLEYVTGSTPIYSTADVGAVQIVIDARGIRVRTSHLGSGALTAVTVHE
ncbi:MAG: ComEC/Rec2 family competence protein [Phycisphaerales bacterium]|nr:MAG: ComEC/Rec2 family competence protein [Phycisphaerales bacterium]